MRDLLVELIKDLKKTNGGHIFYPYKSIESYLQNAVSYIVTGVNNGDQVLFVENERNLHHINKELEKHLSKGQLDNVHFMNNFDFYFSNGDFHPETVFNYFSTHIEPFVEKDAAICTWGLIEWGDVKEYISKIEEYERKIDKVINENGIISVCAYDFSRTPEDLKEKLMKFHGIMITDDDYMYLND